VAMDEYHSRPLPDQVSSPDLPDTQHSNAWTLTELIYWHKHENRHAERRNYCVMCTFAKQEYLHGDSNYTQYFVVNLAYRLLRVNTYRRIRQITTNTCFIIVSLHTPYWPSLRLLVLVSEGFIIEGTSFCYEVLSCWQKFRVKYL
jgi:hypothetical protein